MKTRNVAKVIRSDSTDEFEKEVTKFVIDKDIVSVSAYHTGNFNHCALIIYREFV